MSSLTIARRIRRRGSVARQRLQRHHRGARRGSRGGGDETAAASARRPFRTRATLREARLWSAGGECVDSDLSAGLCHAQPRCARRISYLKARGRCEIIRAVRHAWSGQGKISGGLPASRAGQRRLASRASRPYRLSRGARTREQDDIVAGGSVPDSMSMLGQAPLSSAPAADRPRHRRRIPSPRRSASTTPLIRLRRFRGTSVRTHLPRHRCGGRATGRRHIRSSRVLS